MLVYAGVYGTGQVSSALSMTVQGEFTVTSQYGRAF